MKVGDVICVVDFHDLCPQQVRDFVGNLSRTLSQSRRNGIWAYNSLCLATQEWPDLVSLGGLDVHQNDAPTNGHLSQQ